MAQLLCQLLDKVHLKNLVSLTHKTQPISQINMSNEVMTVRIEIG